MVYSAWLGLICVTGSNKSLSRTGVVVRDAVFEIYKTSPEHRILVCAPINKTCDMLYKSLKKMIPESIIQESLDGVADAFRAVVKSPVWARKEDAETNVSSRDISRQSVSTSSLLKTPTNISNQDISRRSVATSCMLKIPGSAEVEVEKFFSISEV